MLNFSQKSNKYYFSPLTMSRFHFTHFMSIEKKENEMKKKEKSYKSNIRKEWVDEKAKRRKKINRLERLLHKLFLVFFSLIHKIKVSSEHNYFLISRKTKITSMNKHFHLHFSIRFYFSPFSPLSCCWQSFFFHIFLSTN